MPFPFIDSSSIPTCRNYSRGPVLHEFNNVAGSLRAWYNCIVMGRIPKISRLNQVKEGLPQISVKRAHQDVSRCLETHYNSTYLIPPPWVFGLVCSEFRVLGLLLHQSVHCASVIASFYASCPASIAMLDFIMPEWMPGNAGIWLAFRSLVPTSPSSLLMLNVTTLANHLSFLTSSTDSEMNFSYAPYTY